MATYVKTIPM